DREIVNARVSHAYQPVLHKLPVLIPVGAEPMPCVIMPFVREAHGDAMSAERPQLLDQAVLELSRPLAGQEGDDLRPAVDEFRAVSPAGIRGCRPRPRARDRASSRRLPPDGPSRRRSLA